MNLCLMQFFQEKNLPNIKEGTYVKNLSDKKSKQTYWVSFLFLTKIRLHTLILLELNIFLKNY